MNIENLVRPCAMVTDHLVTEIACSEPELYIDEYGEIRLYKILTLLGFKVDHSSFNHGVIRLDDMIIRTEEHPYLTYKTTVYKGHIQRKKIGHIGTRPILDYHWLYDTYEEKGILQASDIFDYITEDELVNINEVGTY